MPKSELIASLLHALTALKELTPEKREAALNALDINYDNSEAFNNSRNIMKAIAFDLPMPEREPLPLDDAAAPFEFSVPEVIPQLTSVPDTDPWRFGE